MSKIRRLFCLILVLPLVLFLMLPASAVIGQDGHPCDEHYYENSFLWELEDSTFYGQTFTAHWNYELSGIELYLDSEIDIVAFFLYIFSIEPDGSLDYVLCDGSVTFWGDFSDGPDWYYFDLSDCDLQLSACTQYGIVLETANNTYPIFWAYSTGNRYTEGRACNNEEDGWEFSNDIDFYFRIIGNCDEDPAVCEQPAAPSPPLAQQPAPGGAVVGGDVYPVNKIGLLIPWIAVGVIIIAGGIFLIRRRVHS